MPAHFWVAFPASLLAAAVTTAGILSVRHFERWGQRNTTYLASFAAGVLIYVGATHLLPRAEAEPRRFSLVALAGGILVAVAIVLSHR